MANFLLAFDIGGTHIRAVQVIKGQEHQMIKEGHGPFNSFLEWFRHSGIHKDHVDQVIIAAAGPKKEGKLQMTNLDWDFDKKELQDFFNCPVLLLNDLEAAVHLLPSVEPVIELQGKPGKGTRGLIMPGTGLGEAFIIPAGKKWLAVASEGGHILYKPDLKVGKKLVQMEELLSGSGLSLIHASLTGEKLPPEAVGSLEGEAVRYFLNLLLKEAQNFALRVLPWGGIFFGGSIMRSFAPLLKKMGTKAFTDHPTMEPLLRQIPLAIIPGKDIVLKGALIAAKEEFK